MAVQKKALAELLVSHQILDLDQLEQARREQKNYNGRLTTTIVRLGLVKESALTEFMGKVFGLPTIDLANFEIDSDAVKLVPRQVAEKHLIIPISQAGKSLVVAFSDPSNIFVKDDLALITRMKIEVVIASETGIVAAIDKHFGGSSKIENIVSQMEELDITGGQAAETAVIDQEVGGEDYPIVKFVNAMLIEAIKSGASDIHIEPYEKRFRIRFRIDGSLAEKTRPPQNSASAIVSRIKILAKLDIGERRKPQDGRMKVKMKSGAEVDFRVSVMPTMFGEKIVLRLLDKSILNVDMARIGFEKDDYQKFYEAISQPQGMILITGPTGSGKTTTIYSALNELNKPDVNLSTAEDPVEFNLDGINQVQVSPQIGFTFADALRSFLRQDPEIIMVGEIRDLETAEVAFKAASTGHLVVSTLHTNDAAATISRLVEIGLEPYILAEATSIVVAQRLLRKVCGDCATEFKVPPEVLTKIGVSPEEIPDYKGMRKGQGCETCSGSGLKGRVAIFEVMTMTVGVKEVIYKAGSPLDIKRQAMKDGMRSLRQAALLKVKAGLTTIEEVLNSTVPDIL